MVKKRSLGLTVFASVEISLGLLAALPFLFTLFFIASHLTAYIRLYQGQFVGTTLGLNLALADWILKLTLPFFLMLPLGIGIFRLNALARRLNLVIVPLCFMVFYFLMYGVYGIYHEWKQSIKTLSYFLNDIMVNIRMFFTVPLVYILISVFFSGFIIFYLTRPSVKEQFK